MLWLRQRGDGVNKLVSYWVQRTGAPRIDSDPTPVNVDLRTPGGGDPDPDPTTPEHENIKPPEVQCGTSPVNTIGTGDYGKNATATIFRVGVDLDVIWAVGDVIQLYWGTVSAPELPLVPVTATNQGANIPIPVPFANVIETVGAADVDVYFTVTRVLDGTNSVTVKSMVQVVPVRSNGELPNDGNPIDKASFPEKNASNIITRAAGINGTTVEVTLTGISNIEVAKNPRISYDFVGLASGDSTTPVGAPIEASRLKADNVAITQDMLDAGVFVVPLPYSLTYFICRNGATFNYTIGNDIGNTGGAQVFVRFAMNQGGGTCSAP